MGRAQVLRVKERFEYGWGVHAGQNLGTFMFARKVPFWAKIRTGGDSLSLENLASFLENPSHPLLYLRHLKH
jgi:hypothetical protein